MVDTGGYYIIRYNYIDKRGHLRNIQKTRGNFDSVIELYKYLLKMKKSGNHKAPIKKPKLSKIINNEEVGLSFNEEFEKWKNK